uniref:RING-type domain-containing protein n=1 Tax=Meloidogyne enterolobii TaxID=390850 RepID=A0A6V7TUN2_MELEN|nr:unnamed protein product [Meloidogyne enterolobii]
MVYYKFGRCVVCLKSLYHENIFTLKNCNHTFHYECITKWISEGSETCPRCRVSATLNDIKQLFVEEACDSSEENNVELTHSECNIITENPTQLNWIMKILNMQSLLKSKNRWKEINRDKCCEKNCINKPFAKYIKGNNYGNLINWDKIKYIKCIVEKRGRDKYVRVYAENLFKKPQNCFDYSLYYFEIKCKIEGELDNTKTYTMNIGLKNCTTHNHIKYSAYYATIYNEKNKCFAPENICWKNEDIFGCGIVYPSSNKLDEEFPYIFFTQNGQQIGKGILRKENFSSYKLFVEVMCCSVETNFGNNLKSKPFKYDISKHLVLKEFY